jgi:hypothetical protein
MTKRGLNPSSSHQKHVRLSLKIDKICSAGFKFNCFQLIQDSTLIIVFRKLFDNFYQNSTSITKDFINLLCTRKRVCVSAFYSLLWYTLEYLSIMIKRLPQSNNKSSASTDLCTIVNPQQIAELCQQKIQVCMWPWNVNKIIVRISL